MTDLDVHDIALLDADHLLLFDSELETPRGQRLQRLEKAGLMMIGSTGSLGFRGAMQDVRTFKTTDAGADAAAAWIGERLTPPAD